MAAPTIEETLERLVLRQSGAFGRHECEPGWEWHPVLTDYDFWFVTAGSGTASMGGSAPQPLGPGSLMLLRPGDAGHVRQDPRDRLTVLYCHFGFSDPVSGAPVTLEDAQLPPRHVRVTQVGPVADTLYRVVRRLRDRSSLGRYAASGMLMDLLAQVYALDAAAAGGVQSLDTRLQDAIEQILERPARRASLDEVARSVGLSAAQLSRLFVTQLGTTYRRYVVDARLDRARELLEHTVMSVQQIALVLGYSDQFLLSRQFRAKYGEPPSAYRDSVHDKRGS